MKEHDLTLLSEGQIWVNSSESRLEVIRKYGIKSAITDLCVLTGSYLREDTIDEDSSLTGRTSWFWTRSDDGSRDVVVVFRRVIGASVLGMLAMVLFAQLCNLL